VTATIDSERLRALVEDGTVSCRRHGSLPLRLYNYTPACQFERRWCDLSRQCRGLVLDDDYGVVARPFHKFFNLEDVPDEIPWHLPYRITEKLDGSLIIAFHYVGRWHCATRGDFNSWQARAAAELLATRYAHVRERLTPGLTYCFEYISPANRVVIAYPEEDIVLLTAFEPDGREAPLPEDCGLRRARTFDFATPIAELKQHVKEGEEGYVVRFENGYRCKIKGDEYVRVHRLVTGVSPKTVWEFLSAGQDISGVLVNTPDELNEWVRSVVADLRSRYDAMLERVNLAASDVADLPTRKEQAAALQSHWSDVQGCVFRLLDGKSPESIIWKAIRPEHAQPFRRDNEG
jgi:RNA ligase